MDVWITVLIIIIIIFILCHGPNPRPRNECDEELGTQVDESTKFGILTLMSVVVPTKPWFISFSKSSRQKMVRGIYIHIFELLIAEFIYMT